MCEGIVTNMLISLFLHSFFPLRGALFEGTPPPPSEHLIISCHSRFSIIFDFVTVNVNIIGRISSLFEIKCLKSYLVDEEKIQDLKL